jgi:hypothetical protein
MSFPYTFISETNESITREGVQADAFDNGKDLILNQSFPSLKYKVLSNQISNKLTAPCNVQPAI